MKGPVDFPKPLGEPSALRLDSTELAEFRFEDPAAKAEEEASPGINAIYRFFASS